MFGIGLCYDLCLMFKDLELLLDVVGCINVWCIGDDGCVIGLIDYFGGMFGLFVKNVCGIVFVDVMVDCFLVLFDGWNVDIVVLVDMEMV